MELQSTPGLAVKKAVGRAVFYSEAFAVATRDAATEFGDPVPSDFMFRFWGSIANQFGFLLHLSHGPQGRGYHCQEIE